MAQRYYYGGFAIHDGVNYFVTQKDLSLPAFKQTLFQIARYEGVKKTGERIDEKQIPVTIKVVGTSRPDLESKLDALYQALALRQQHLLIHALDNRYYIADAVAGQARLVPGRVIACDVSITFVAQQPFAYAASASSYSSGNLVMVAGGSSTTWNLPAASNPLTLTGAGNTFARPVIRITNETPTNATTLSAGLTNGTPTTTLSIAALPQAATSGQVFLLVSGTHSQRVTLSANALAGATSLTVTSFTPNFSYPSTSFCGLDIYLQGFQLSQNPDGQILSVSNMAVQTIGNGDSFVIDCDPLTSSNGYTVITSSDNALQSFTGSFPVIEPGTTQFALVITCSNQPTVLVQVDWTPRWRA